MNRDEFGRLFDAAMVAWPDAKNLKNGYYHNLKDLRDEHLSSAFKWVGKNWERVRGMPAPGDIRVAADRFARDAAKGEPSNFAVTAIAHELMSGGLRKALASNTWHPKTQDERDGADKFREILAAHHGVRFCGHDGRKLVNTWPKMDGAYLRAFNEFGGREALRLIDESSVMLARETYTKAYVKHATSDNP